VKLRRWRWPDTGPATIPEDLWRFICYPGTVGLVAVLMAGVLLGEAAICPVWVLCWTGFAIFIGTVTIPHDEQHTDLHRLAGKSE